MENRLWDKMKYYACEEIAGKITDYRNLTLTGREIKTDILRARYALLPVWLINYERKGENHQIALNGQTGKLIGSLRISLLKIVLGIAAVGSLFWYLILAFGGWLV